MTATTAAQRSAARDGKAPATPATPNGFMQEMTRLVRAGRAEAAAAHFDRHSPAVLGGLSEAQRTLLDALMEYVDTVIDLERELPPGPLVTQRARSESGKDTGEL